MNRKLMLAVTVFVTVAAVIVATAAAGSGGSASTLPVRDTAGDSPQYTTNGSVTPLAGANTIAHWAGSFTDPTNSQTYSYTMVGADPASNSAATIPTDIIPVKVVFDANAGYSLDGTNRVAAVEASPLFQSNDYSTVPASSGGPGVLSPGNVGQLEDATMRSQFNKIGSGYHLYLGQPTVHPTVTITVPKDKGSAFMSGRGLVYGLVDVNWFSAQVMSILGSTHADPTHLPIILTDNVMLYIGNYSNCCIIGYHGAALPVGVGSGSANGNGKQQVQTFAYAAYSTPGLFRAPYIADIHALSHEISEWGDDPFVNNYVDPWVTPTAPQYGCTGLLETGDPVVGIGFKIGTNTFDSSNRYADGYWHPEDEVFLPWFARQSPNTTSEPTQSPSANGGRYTFMGDLNPFSGFRSPATGC